MDVVGSAPLGATTVCLGAAFIVLAALYTASSASSLWHLLEQVSRHSIVLLVVLLVIAAIVICIASIFVVPIWVAWMTDVRIKAKVGPQASLRPVDLSGPRQSMAAIQQSLLSEKIIFHPTSEPVAAAIDNVFSLMMRDFVKAWHSPLLSGSPQCTSFDTPSSRHFPDMVEITIRTSLSTLVELFSNIDIARLGICTLLPTLTRHLKLFEKAEAEWRRSPSAAEFAEGVEGDLFLATLYNDGVLHPAVGDIASPDTRLTELAHLRKIVERAMKHVLPEREAKSNGVQIVVRELIACAFLKPVVDGLSDPDSLNALLEEKAGAALQEQKLVSKLREALDKQGSLSTTSKKATSSSPGSSIPRKTKLPKSSETSYDSFMVNISQSKSILDARRTRNGLLQQIRKTETALADDGGHMEGRRRDLRVYKQRLQAAVEAVDYRMDQLGTAPLSDSDQRNNYAKINLTDYADMVELRDVLTSSSAISYFLEFCEGRDCSILVQFWLSVNTFKNPLEVAESDSEDENDDISTRTSTSALALQPAHQDEIRTLNEDLSFFVETCYQSDKLKRIIKAKYIKMAKDYVQGYASGQLHASNRTIRLVRRSVLRAQKQVYDELVEEEWPSFRKSPSWHQVVEDLQRERAEQAPTVTSSSSFFLDHKEVARDPTPRPSTTRAVSHAHLFGMSDEIQQKSPTGSLFAEDKDEKSLRYQTHTTTSLDQLMGGKGVAFKALMGARPSSEKPSLTMKMLMKKGKSFRPGEKRHWCRLIR